MADEYIQLSKKAYDNLNDEERESIIDLAKDKSIITVSPLSTKITTNSPSWTLA